MAWYSRRRTQASWQIGSDVFVVLWTVGWFAVGRWVDHLIRAVADPVRATARQAEAASQQFREAADRTGQIPGIGDTLRKPLDDTVASLGEVVASANQQVAAIELTATVTGIVIFAIPFLVLLAVWLPRRIAFVRASSAGQRLIADAAGVDLLALRALTNQPLDRIRAVSPQAPELWRSGDPTVVTRLAELEMHRLGLRRPGKAVTGDQDQV